MKVFLLGLDGATWDVIGPLAESGDMPNLARLKKQGASGTLGSVFPPLSPVAWTGVMTGKNSGKHGVFEFLEYNHDPLHGRVNSSRAIQSDLVWEIAARHGKTTVAGGVPMSYPHRKGPGFFLGDFLSPPDAKDFASDAALFAELEQHVGPYRPWSTAVHDGGREPQALAELQGFLEHHLKAVQFLMKRCPWDLFMYDLMATDRAQHELWHVWDPKHRVAKGRDLSKLREGYVQFWRTLDDGIGAIEASLPPDTALILMSDHGFGAVEWFVNFNVWLLERGDLALQNSFYVKQKKWFYDRGATPEAIYNLMIKLGLAEQRVGRFRGKQTGPIERLAESAFLSRRHIDWSKTKAYSQGNFGQIFINQRGRQPQGCVAPEDVRPLIEDLKAGLMAIPHPETGEPLVERVVERDEIYQGPHSHLAPDLTVVLRDWRYRTIGLHDFTTNKLISPAFGPTGDHRMEGVMIATGRGIQPGASPDGATLLDIAPTVLRLLGVPVPGDMDGRVLRELINEDEAPAPPQPAADPKPADAPADPPADTTPPPTEGDADSAYTEEEDAAIQQRLADLGYL